jgi:hypothetical protein
MLPMWPVEIAVSRIFKPFNFKRHECSRISHVSHNVSSAVLLQFAALLRHFGKADGSASPRVLAKRSPSASKCIIRRKA